ncbi:MAG: tRNA (uridine(34)/cytosine(34)/5-carboxymethylaminomethyluridine(34)-2'-O)-methyltransferase TrmL [Bdellovibrionales bacterium]|nr:tRNA (uridine(34)/cytosine(34)/5-carboxymethylaminomethyluridine(34)-2'-O)-methyltransferase TrmL [Bdellovibrionales bacterium]
MGSAPYILAMHVVLVEPQIPQNTGSIARTCAATKTALHLIEPMPFKIDEKRVKRAGLDYWPYVELHQHASWEEYLKTANPERIWYFSKFGERSYYEADYKADDCLVFGSETKGLGKQFLSAVSSHQIVRIPIFEQAVRSLNLSNAVSIGLYEALRQLAQQEKSP